MAAQMFTSPAYMVPRVAVWLLLFIWALVDGILHRHESSRARKLYSAVVIVLGAIVLQDILLLLNTILGVRAIFTVFIFFTDLADSLFMALMLMIAAGFCITRDDLGPYKTKVTAIPWVYLVTVLIVDYTMYEVRGKQAFDVMTDPDAPVVRHSMSEWQSMLLLVAAILNLFALCGAIIYVFDTVAKERHALEQPEQDVYAGAAMERGAAGLPPSSLPAEGPIGQGHAVARPPENNPEVDARQPNVYGEITAEDLDSTKTVQEKVARRAKIRLLKQFSFGVGVYALSTFGVILVPIFMSSNVSSDTAMKVVLILQNIVYWLFMLGLAYIFRLRGDSPYLMVGEDEAVGLSDDVNNITTELGVLDGDNGSEGGGSMDNFSLHDLDDEDKEDHRPAAVAHHAPARNGGALDSSNDAPRTELLKDVPRSDTVP